MTWNHRVVRMTTHLHFRDGKVHTEEAYGIHEVYYGMDVVDEAAFAARAPEDERDLPVTGEVVDAPTTEPIRITEATLDELRETVGRIVRALDRPVFEGGDRHLYQTDDDWVDGTADGPLE